MKKIGFTETILRDANQSLAATRMRISDFSDILAEMDKVGYYSVECWGGATFDSCLRYLHEDPWERLRIIREKMPNTKLQMLLRGQNLLGYKHYPSEIVRSFIKQSILNGIDIIRIFDALNDLDNIKESVYATLENGGHPSCAMSYTVSPVHTTQDYVEMAKKMVNLGAMSICIKDMSGCLMPKVAYELISKLKDAVSVPVILHTHCTAGIAEMTCLKAIEAGVDVIDTATACFSGGTSQPPTETMAMIAKECDREVNVDIDRMLHVNRHFKSVFDRLFKEGNINYHSMQTDVNMLVTQIPGGMYSNLRKQLKDFLMLDRIDDVIAEVPRVRKDLGYPPLVTPISQMVGTQAVFNVLYGERYKSILDSVASYVKGEYGPAPGEIDPKVKELILAHYEKKQQGKELSQETGVEKSYNDDISTEEMLTRSMFPALAEEFYNKKPEDDAYYYTCSEHLGFEDDQQQAYKKAHPDEDMLAIMNAILSMYTKIDADQIHIKNVYTCV